MYTHPLRVYEMFMGPLDAMKPWSTKGVDGARRFLERVYRLFDSVVTIDDSNKTLEKVYHQTVKKVTVDYDNFRFNTAISQMMIFTNEAYKNPNIPREYLEGFLKLLNPIAPHITEELWEKLGHNESIAYEKWPVYDEAKTVENLVTVVVQVNGKLRDKLEVSANTSKEELEALALASPKVQANLEGKTPKKVIVVPNKLVSIVA